MGGELVSVFIFYPDIFVLGNGGGSDRQDKN
jgi:hypothetical protein